MVKQPELDAESIETYWKASHQRLPSTPAPRVMIVAVPHLSGLAAISHLRLSWAQIGASHWSTPSCSGGEVRLEHESPRKPSENLWKPRSLNQMEAKATGASLGFSSQLTCVYRDSSKTCLSLNNIHFDSQHRESQNVKSRKSISGMIQTNTHGIPWLSWMVSSDICICLISSAFSLRPPRWPGHLFHIIA